VTSVDVNNLIPVVSESLTGGEGVGTEPAGNVWASGAATAAFDAFDYHGPLVASGDRAPGAAAPIDTGHVIDHVISPPDDIQPAAVDDYFTDTGITTDPQDDSSLQFSHPVVEDAPATHADFGSEWAAPTVDDHHHHDDGGAGFDLFS